MGTAGGAIQTMRDIGRTMLDRGLDCLIPTPPVKVRPEIALLMFWLNRNRTEKMANVANAVERICPVDEVFSDVRAAGPGVNSVVREFMLMLQISWEWANYGFPTFRLTEALTAGLAMTSCKGQPGDELKFPFPCFLLELPESMAVVPYAIGMKPDGEVVSSASRHVFFTDGVWMEDIARAKVPSYAGMFSLIVTHLRMQEILLAVNNGTMLMGEEELRSVRALEAGTRDKIGNMMGEEMYSLCSLVEHISVEGCTISNSAPQVDAFSDVEEFVLFAGYEPGKNGESFHVCQAPSEEGEFIKRIVVNLATYLAMRPDEWPRRAKKPPPKSRKKKKIRAVVRHNEDLKTWTVGKAIQLPEHLIRAAASKEGRGAGRKLNSRVFTQGHWRNQACGKGRKERKRIWIEPFYKGPSGARQIEKLYDVKTLEEAGFTDA